MPLSMRLSAVEGGGSEFEGGYLAVLSLPLQRQIGDAVINHIFLQVDRSERFVFVAAS